MKSTNYYNTLIEVAEDCKKNEAVIPPQKENKLTIANIQFDIIYDNPYKYSSDDVIFQAHMIKKNIPNDEYQEERTIFFSKGQPCLRCSPLSKSYAWGIHHNSEGKIAIYPKESIEYSQLINDNKITKIKAMRNKRK